MRISGKCFLLIFIMIISLGSGQVKISSPAMGIPPSKEAAGEEMLEPISGDDKAERENRLDALQEELGSLIASSGFGGARTIKRVSPFGKKVELTGPATSVYIRDLGSGDTVDINADSPNLVASTQKIIVVASVYYYWKNGRLDMNQYAGRIHNDFVLIMSESSNTASNDLIRILGKAYLHGLSGGSNFEGQNKKERETTLALACLVRYNGGEPLPEPDSCVKDMASPYHPVIKLNQLTSSPTAYMLFGMIAINDFLENSLPEFKGRVREWIPDTKGPHYGQTYLNQASARDMGLLLEAIYEASFLPQASALEILEIMAANFKGRDDPGKRKKLSKPIPPEVAIATKTGYVNGGNGDIAIVFLDRRPYVISVFVKSDGQKEARAASLMIAAISEKTYKYLTRPAPIPKNQEDAAYAYKH